MLQYMPVQSGDVWLWMQLDTSFHKTVAFIYLDKYLESGKISVQTKQL